MSEVPLYHRHAAADMMRHVWGRLGSGPLECSLSFSLSLSLSRFLSFCFSLFLSLSLSLSLSPSPSRFLSLSLSLFRFLCFSVSLSLLAGGCVSGREAGRRDTTPCVESGGCRDTILCVKSIRSSYTGLHPQTPDTTRRCAFAALYIRPYRGTSLETAPP